MANLVTKLSGNRRQPRAPHPADTTAHSALAPNGHNTLVLDTGELGEGGQPSG